MSNIEFNKLRKNKKNNIENTINNDEDYIHISNNSLKHHIKYNLIKDLKIVKSLNLKLRKFDGINFDCIEFNNCNLENSIFINCKMENVRFINCKMKKLIIKDSELNKIIFENNEMKKSNFINCDIKSNIIRDCDFKGASLIECNIYDFEFDDRLLTKFDEDTFFDKLKTEDEEDNFNFYKSIAYKFQQNNLLNHYGEYFYIYKISERKKLKGLEKLKSICLWLICGYGERPTYTLITSLEIIFLFTIMYMIFGLKLVNENVYLGLSINDFFRAFHFSIVTFTTVGYGDITPSGYSILLSGIEMFLGVTMVGIWTATLARKINR